MGKRDRAKRSARQKQAIPHKPRLLVICEGSRTEPEYLRGFQTFCKNNLIEIEIHGGRGIPQTLLAYAIERKKAALKHAKRMADVNLLFDQVWCVFDVDEHPNMGATRDEARQQAIKLAISNPCFELWLYLHFAEPPGLCHRHAMQRLLRDHVPGYDKSVVFDTFQAGYHLARQRAERLENSASERGDDLPNPCTTVWQLTEVIRSPDKHPQNS